MSLEPGQTVHPEGETGPHLELVVSGVVRAHISAADGRTMTVRYCRRGALLGAATLFTEAPHAFGIQALTGAEMLRMRPAHVRRLAEREHQVALVLLAETSERALTFVAELSGNAFSTVAQRVARHLLTMAEPAGDEPHLIASVTQQELADASGTVREVVVRVLREFRAAGLVSTSRHAVTVLRLEDLLAVSEGEGWNNSS